MALRSVNQLDSATVLSIPVDVRGWEVRTSLDDDKVGKVHDVLVDEAGTGVADDEAQHVPVAGEACGLA